MRVLVVGSGGREHALAWALSNSPLLTKLFVAPGNPGTAMLAENVPIGVLDIPALVDFALRETDRPGPARARKRRWWQAWPMRVRPPAWRCCGPTAAAAAALEGSKSFAKEICDAAGIPTALWERFSEAGPALAFVARRGAPIVVKADGLAAGKGVVVAHSEAEAEAAIRAMLQEGSLGEAGAKRGDRGMPVRR